jgi:LuxR family maltose regulon positive regulatory protein
LAGRNDPNEFVRHFSGNNRFIGDYLTEEVLSRQSDDVHKFILAMSIVDRFSAALGDYMTGGHQSANILRELQQTNLFLIPLDAEGRWFRFHNLFGAVARSALETEHPDRVAMLHARARLRATTAMSTPPWNTHWPPAMLIMRLLSCRRAGCDISTLGLERPSAAG